MGWDIIHTVCTLVLLFHVIAKQLNTLRPTIKKFRKAVTEELHSVSHPGFDIPDHFFIRCILMSAKVCFQLQHDKSLVAPSLNCMEDVGRWWYSTSTCIRISFKFFSYFFWWYYYVISIYIFFLLYFAIWASKLNEVHKMSFFVSNPFLYFHSYCTSQIIYFTCYFYFKTSVSL